MLRPLLGCKASLCKREKAADPKNEREDKAKRGKAAMNGDAETTASFRLSHSAVVPSPCMSTSHHAFSCNMYVHGKFGGALDECKVAIGGELSEEKLIRVPGEVRFLLRIGVLIVARSGR